MNSAGDPVYVRGGEEAILEDEGDVHDLSKSELQDLLVARGLPKSGTKEELIERLSS